MFEKMILQNILAEAGLEQTTVVAAEKQAPAGYSWSEDELERLEESALRIKSTSTNNVAVAKADALLAAINDARSNDA